MIRTFDSSKFNVIANDPSVKPWMGASHDGNIDLHSKVCNSNNFAFITECGNGGYVLENNGNGLYVAHTLAIPSARGKPMYDLMIEGFAFMFLQTDAIEIATFVPDTNKPALRWTELAGFRPTFRREGHHPYNGEMVGGQYFIMTYQDWVAKAPGLKEEGEKFHDALEAAQGHENHPEDEFHDRMVGATMLGCKASNTIKSIFLYNRWAGVAGYHLAEVLTSTPPMVNIGNAIMQLNNGSVEILKVFPSQKSSGDITCQ